MINIAERINELMNSKGWSAYELSLQTDISANTVYAWFQSGAIPETKNIIKICNTLGITLEQFFCGGSYKFSEEENKALNEWCALSDLEKSTIKNLIETFKILKSNSK